MKARWYRLYPEDFVAGIAGELTEAELGVYWMICLLCYTHGGSIHYDLDWLRRKFRPSKGNWIIKPILDHLIAMGKVIREEDEISVRRVRDEVEISLRSLRDAAENGSRGGRPSKKTNGIGKGSGLHKNRKERKEEDSEAKASGAADPPQPAQPPDPVKEIFDRGLAILGGDNPRHRSILGKMRKHYSDPAVLAAIIDCETEAPSNPAAFFVACCERRKKTNGRGDAQSGLAKLAEWARGEDEPQGFRGDHKAAGGSAR